MTVSFAISPRPSPDHTERPVHHARRAWESSQYATIGHRAAPGRVDLAIELQYPDAEDRLKLFEFYARGLEMQGVDLLEIENHLVGASSTFIKELLRKAALLTAEDGDELVETQDHLTETLAETNNGDLLGKIVLGALPAAGDRHMN